MQTRTYNVMPTFSSFARRFERVESYTDSGAKVKNRDYLKEGLIDWGIEFPKGASTAFDLKTLKFTVTNTEEGLTLVEILLDSLQKESEKKVHVYYEFIEVDHDELSNWIFENTMDNDATELRNEVQKWIKSGRAEIIEAVVVAARSGQRAKIESGEEFIYPTEYDPGEIPNKVNLNSGAKATSTGVTPTAFETRNLGVTLEVDPVVGSAGVVVDLNLAPEIVKLEEIAKWPVKSIDPKFQTEMPTFYTMKITTQVTGKSGHYILMGTTRPLKSADPKRSNPIVLHFVRSDVSFTGAWSVDKGK